MRRLILLLVTLGAIACKSGDDPPPPSYCDVPHNTNLLPAPIFEGTLSGDYAPGFIGGRTAAAYNSGSAFAQFTVIDGAEVDDANRPVAELFIFLRSEPAEGRVSLVPVKLVDLHNPSFFPSGSFAVYARDYSVAAGDYTKWLIGSTGCLRVTHAGTGAVSALESYVAFSGKWFSNTGATIGNGSVEARVFAPLVNLASAPTPFLDHMQASVTGVRAKPFEATTINSYQVLRAGQERLVIVATQPADTTRELWLSIAGVRPSTYVFPDQDSIALEPLTLAEAKSGRTDPTRSFAMMRMLTLDNTGHDVVSEIWRATSGYVKFTRVIQNGPLAICGAVSGTFALTTQGVSLNAPATDLGVTTFTNGAFDSRISVLSQADSLVDAVIVPAAPSRFNASAPVSKKGTRCR